MRKPKIQPFIPLVLRCPQIVVLLLGTHRIPDPVARIVPPNVVDLDEDCHDNVPGHKRKENLVSSPIVGFVVLAIDLLELAMPRKVYWSNCVLTFEEIIELAWQIMLYTALPTVRARTVPALRDVRLTGGLLE